MLRENENDGLHRKTHPTVEEGVDPAEIVLTRGELKAMLDMAAKNALTMVEDRIVDAIESSAIESATSSIGAAVLIAGETLVNK